MGQRMATVSLLLISHFPLRLIAALADALGEVSRDFGIHYRLIAPSDAMAG